MGIPVRIITVVLAELIFYLEKLFHERGIYLSSMKKFGHLASDDNDDYTILQGVKYFDISLNTGSTDSIKNCLNEAGHDLIRYYILLYRRYFQVNN